MICIEDYQLIDNKLNNLKSPIHNKILITNLDNYIDIIKHKHITNILNLTNKLINKKKLNVLNKPEVLNFEYLYNCLKFIKLHIDNEEQICFIGSKDKILFLLIAYNIVYVVDTKVDLTQYKNILKFKYYNILNTLINNI